MRKLVLALILFVPFNSFAQTPTWADDIACVVYTHCSSCHNANGIAPFPLMDYNDAVINSSQIQFKVLNQSMPPWPPDEKFRHLAHERILTLNEINAINLWVNAGTPQGNPGNAPPMPVFNTSLEIPNPDFSERIPTFTVPATNGSDIYKCFVIQTTEGVDKFITGMEIIPGNRNIVHHVLIYQDNSNIPIQLDAADPSIGYTCFGGVGSNNAKLITGWVPGSSADFTPTGMGYKLDANTNLVVQIHYPDGSTGQIDSTRVNFKFSSVPSIRELTNDAVLNHFTSLTNGPLAIPANSIKTFHEQYVVPIPMTITAIGPHAHLICESMNAYAVTPVGDTIPLIDIPHWDFEWQGFYSFQQPIYLPVGTTIHGYATYNNTSSNPNNPSNPPLNVFAGEETTDEMMIFFISFLPFQSGDNLIVIDTSSHFEHYLNCSIVFNSLNEPILNSNTVHLYPNPASNQITLEINGNGWNDDYVFSLVDALGRNVLNQNISYGINVLSLPENITNGTYFYTLEAIRSNEQYADKLILIR